MKTWKDLKHGDRLRVEDEEWIVIDVLPNSIILLQQGVPDAIRDVKIFTIYYMASRGWQIVQPEEEETISKSHQGIWNTAHAVGFRDAHLQIDQKKDEFYSQGFVDYKNAFLRLDAAILNLKLEREEVKEKYPHLFN